MICLLYCGIGADFCLFAMPFCKTNQVLCKSKKCPFRLKFCGGMHCIICCIIPAKSLTLARLVFYTVVIKQRGILNGYK